MPGDRTEQGHVYHYSESAGGYWGPGWENNTDGVPVAVLPPWEKRKEWRDKWILFLPQKEKPFTFSGNSAEVQVFLIADLYIRKKYT